MRKYNKVVIAGTFDHLHKGHKALLTLAFKVGERVTIGLVKEPFGKLKILADKIEDYQVRRSALSDYLKERGYLPHAKIYPLNDIYGNAAIDEKIEVLVATRETYKSARLVNRKRVENGKKRLKIIIGSLIKSKGGKIIRSELIRRGEMDRDGFEYSNLFRGKKILVLPRNLRSLLRIPIGRVVKGGKGDWGGRGSRGIRRNIMIITVGDIITSEMIKAGVTPDIQIVDFRARRAPIKLLEIRVQSGAKKARNRAGTISAKSARSVYLAIQTWFKTKKKQQVIIRGEEDLIALPAILFAPLGAIVLYGQWDLRGAVVVTVTEEVKKKVKKIISSFKSVD